MTGYQWTPKPPAVDPASLVALLRRENQRLARELTYWKHAAQRQEGERQ